MSHPITVSLYKGDGGCAGRRATLVLEVDCWADARTIAAALAPARGVGLIHVAEFIPDRPGESAGEWKLEDWRI